MAGEDAVGHLGAELWCGRSVGKCQVLCINEGSGGEELLQAAGGGAEGGLEGEAFPLLSWREEDGAANVPFLPLMGEEEDPWRWRRRCGYWWGAS